MRGSMASPGDRGTQHHGSFHLSGDFHATSVEAEWLAGAFSAGDLLMATVLLTSRSSGLLDEYPNLAAHVARGEARAAYPRAFAARREVFARNGRGAE